MTVTRRYLNSNNRIECANCLEPSQLTFELVDQFKSAKHVTLLLWCVACGAKCAFELTVRYIGDGEQKTRGFNPPKLYRAKYTPPAATPAPSVADLDDL